MKIIDAVWEKRNLGIETVEITVEQDDSCEYVEKCLTSQDASYCVVKIPTYRTDLLELIQKCGYRYIEDMVSVTSHLNEVTMNHIQKRMFDAVNVELMNENDLEFLREQIMDGLFDSDRIYIDSSFTIEQARNRYVNWLNDEIDRKTEIYKYIYKDKVIGFFGLKHVDNGHYTSFLGGIYKEYRKGGLGTIVKVPDVVRQKGGKSVSTSVSSNNLTQIKSLLSNGYVVDEITHTFVKHNCIK